MDMDMDDTEYLQAARGNFEAFQGLNAAQLLELVTPTNKDTILHIHITARFNDWTTKFYWPLIFSTLYVPPIERIILKDLRKSSNDFVERVLERCGDSMRWKANAEDETLLHLAARYGHNDILQLLLIPKIQHGRKSTSGDEEAAEATSEVQEEVDDIEAARRMLGMVTKSGETALHEAARNNHPQVIKTLIELDPDHSYGTNSDGMTPLFLAVSWRRRQAAYLILNMCASPAYQGPNGMTALHVAVQKNDIVMTRMLTSKMRTLTTVPDEKGQVPLHYAAEKGFLRIVIILMKAEKSAATIGESDHNMIALHLAARSRRTNVMREIMSRCPRCCEQVDNRGNNLLHFAVEGNSRRTVDAALSHPFVRLNLVSRKNIQGKGPFDGHPFYPLLIGSNQRYRKSVTVIMVVWRFLNIFMRELGEVEDLNIFKDSGDYIDEVKDDELEKITTENKDELKTYLVVATLVATVTFTAGFTVPGGYITDDKGPGPGPEQGSPVLAKSLAFKIFFSLNVISLVSSVAAVLFPIYLMQYRINTRRLQRKTLSFAKGATFIGLIMMLSAFMAGTYAVLPWGPTPLFLVASVVVICSFVVSYTFAILRWV